MTAPTRWMPAVDRRAVLVFALALAGLLAPWPGLGRGFAFVFCGYANGVTGVLGLGGDAAPRFSLR